MLKLNEAVRNLVDNTKLPIHEAVNAASLNPAKALGLDGEIGSLEMGKRADIAIADDAFHIASTILGGKTVYSAQGEIA